LAPAFLGRRIMWDLLMERRSKAREWNLGGRSWGHEEILERRSQFYIVALLNVAKIEVCIGIILALVYTWLRPFLSTLFIWCYYIYLLYRVILYIFVCFV
jgi:hypothetical protein